ENHSPLLPLDSDLRWNQCAPADQQVDPAALGGARAVLTNLSPTGRLEVTIPRHTFALRTVFGGYPRRKSVTHDAKLHTVIIEPDEQRLMVVWHSHLGLGRAVDDIDHTIVLEGEGTNG
ncbi:MAG: DUF2169 domain-containing protein, partial [Archangium sp.]|nr:DUF2169 domain-containing protein [Archangium sp.]